MVDGLTGRTGLIARKSVAQENRFEQDPAQTQLLNTMGQTAREKTQKHKTATLITVLVSFL